MKAYDKKSQDNNLMSMEIMPKLLILYAQSWNDNMHCVCIEGETCCAYKSVRFILPVQRGIGKMAP